MGHSNIPNTFGTEGGKMTLQFKQAIIDDSEKVLSLFKVAAEAIQKRGLNQWQHWLNPPEDYVNWVQNGLNNSEYFFVEKENELVGMFRLMETDEEYWGKNDDSARYIHSFVTLPEYAGQGIGSSVLRMIAEQVAAQNIPLLRLDCKADNVALVSYYERQGFTKVRLQEMPHYAVQLFEKRLNS
jgi:ribosomal protein S18 acetylase RimI-like enzyme